VIGRITGSLYPDEIIIIGAHIDTVPNSPGGEDDASGVSTIVEALRAVVEAGYAPARTVEFIGWSCEELGLVGSQQMAADYRSKGIKVVAMLQLDMLGYESRLNQGIAIFVDFTDPILQQLMADLVHVYTDRQAGWSRCGYGCSDHASWHKQNYKAIMVNQGDHSESR